MTSPHDPGTGTTDSLTASDGRFRMSTQSLFTGWQQAQAAWRGEVPQVGNATGDRLAEPTVPQSAAEPTDSGRRSHLASRPFGIEPAAGYRASTDAPPAPDHRGPVALSPAPSEEQAAFAAPRVAAVSAYAGERAEQLVAELRDIGVVRDVLAGDGSGAVARLLHGMLALAITESFLLASALAHREQDGREPAWVAAFLTGNRSVLGQVASAGPVALTHAQLERPRPTLQPALDRLAALEAGFTANGGGSA